MKLVNAVVTILSMTAGCASLTRGQSTADAPKIDWRIDATLPIQPHEAIRWPHVVAGENDDYFVLASLVRRGPDDGPALDKAVMWSSVTGRLPLPPGDFSFMYPTGVWDRAGGLTVVWGEPPEGLELSDRTLSLQIAALWSARFRAGAWSKPERILSGSIKWTAQQRNVFVTEGGAVTVFAVAAKPGSGRRVFRLTRHPSGWAEDSHFPGTEVVAITQTGNTAVAMLQHSRDPLTTISTARATDGAMGEWTEGPLREGLPPLGYGTWWIGASTRSHVWLAWRTPPDSSQKAAVVYTTSVDAGRTWSPIDTAGTLDETPGPGDFIALQCGFAAFGEVSSGPPRPITELRVNRAGHVSRHFLFQGAIYAGSMGSGVSNRRVRVVATHVDAASRDVAVRVASRPEC